MDFVKVNKCESSSGLGETRLQRIKPGLERKSKREWPGSLGNNYSHSPDLR